MTAKNEKYLTIDKPSTGLFKDKGSKFLSFAFPVSSENEIKEIITRLKSEYFDARHHCYAYRLGAEKAVFRANDDGEPSGTAGKPILGQIVSRDLTNILIVVVRYFGGILLGTSGLINAYRNSAIDVLSNSVIVEKYVYAVYNLQFGYHSMNSVMKVVKDYDLKVSDQDFGLSCRMTAKIKLGMAETVKHIFESMEDVNFEFTGEE